MNVKQSYLLARREFFKLHFVGNLKQVHDDSTVLITSSTPYSVCNLLAYYLHKMTDSSYDPNYGAKRDNIDVQFSVDSFPIQVCICTAHSSAMSKCNPLEVEVNTLSIEYALNQYLVESGLLDIHKNIKLERGLNWGSFQKRIIIYIKVDDRRATTHNVINAFYSISKFIELLRKINLREYVSSLTYQCQLCNDPSHGIYLALPYHDIPFCIQHLSIFNVRDLLIDMLRDDIDWKVTSNLSFWNKYSALDRKRMLEAGYTFTPDRSIITKSTPILTAYALKYLIGTKKLVRKHIIRCKSCNSNITPLNRIEEVNWLCNRPRCRTLIGN